MSAIVLDASVALSIIRGERAASVVGEALRGWLRNGDRLVVPAHFWLEIVNALSARHGAKSASIVEAIHLLDTFDLETMDLDRPHLLLVVDVMERHGLSGYDAMYLVLAESLGARLATLDRRLAARAGDRAIRFDRAHEIHETRAAYAAEPTWPDYSGAAAFLSKLRADARKDLEALGR